MISIQDKKKPKKTRIRLRPVYYIIKVIAFSYKSRFTHPLYDCCS